MARTKQTARKTTGGHAPRPFRTQEDDALAKGFEALMALKLISIGLGVVYEIYSITVTKTWNERDPLIFALDAIFFFGFYYTNLVRFIHRFSVTLHVKDLIQNEHEFDRQPVFDAAHKQIRTRKLVVYFFCSVG